MKRFIILDTNVIVSAFLAEPKTKTPPLEALSIILFEKNKIIPVYSDEIIKEYMEVLSRSIFNFSKQRIGKFINDLKKCAIFLLKRTINNEKFNFPDKDDIVFYEVTLSAKKQGESLLITGNLKHYPIKSFVITPTEFIQLYNGKKIEDIRKNEPEVERKTK